MTDKFDAVIQEVALKHGIVLSKDDPILILQTMNDKLLEESRQAQMAMLAQFREEMEAISSQWKDDAKQKAEKVLNAALTGSKQLMVKLIQESVNESTQAINKMLSDSVNQTRCLTQQSQRFSRLALLTSAILICLVILFSYIQV